MNLKFALATALFISSGTFVAQAQQKNNTVKTTTVSAAKAFEKKVASFNNEADAKKAAAIFETLKSEMIEGLSAAKAGIGSAGTDAQRNDATNIMNERVASTNTAIRLFTSDASNKAPIVAALNQYAKTL